MPLPAPTEPTVPPIVNQVRKLALGDSELMRHMADAAGGLAVSLALAALTLALTLWASGWLSRLAARGIERAHRGHTYDTTLQTFTASLVRYFVIIVGLVGVLEQLGVKATSVIAVLGAASLAIGLALQGALANVAAGVMILILRPYRIGDRVEINGKFGTVKGLDLFSTRLADLENRAVFVPNGKAFGEIIVNYTATPAHRVEIDVQIGKHDDIDAALAAMLEVAAADKRVVTKPAPWAKLTALQDNGVKVTLRAWVSPEAWFDARFDLLKAVRDRLAADGFQFPYPYPLPVPPPPPPPAGEPAPREPVSRRPASPRPTTAANGQGR